MTRSAYADRNGIDNSLDINVHNEYDKVMALKYLCDEVLEKARAHYGVPIVPNSGYRCPKLNTAIGGSSSSQHMQGEAVDFEVPGVSNLDLAHWCAANLEFDQLILEFHRDGDPRSGWVHISLRMFSPNRGNVLTIGHNGTTHGLPRK